MMKYTLPILLLSAILLCGCGGDASSADGAETTAPDTTAEIKLPDIAFVGGENAYTLVRPEKADAAALNAIVSFREALVQKLPAVANMGFSDDWVKPGEDGKPYEILIGHTNRPETAEVLSHLRYDDFAIRVVGDTR